MMSLGNGGKWYCGAPPLGKGGFVGGGSATAQKVTRGGSTVTISPISRTLTFGRVGDGKARQPWICGADDQTAGGDGKVTEG